jgi:hypothetical protein
VRVEVRVLFEVIHTFVHFRNTEVSQVNFFVLSGYILRLSVLVVDAIHMENALARKWKNVECIVDEHSLAQYFRAAPMIWCWRKCEPECIRINQDMRARDFYNARYSCEAICLSMSKSMTFGWW